MHSRSYDSPAAIPFLAGHVLWTVLNTSSLTTICFLSFLLFVFPDPHSRAGNLLAAFRHHRGLRKTSRYCKLVKFFNHPLRLADLLQPSVQSDGHLAGLKIVVQISHKLLMEIKPHILALS